MKKFLYWIPSILLSLLIFTLSSRPKISLSDKTIVDFIIFKSLHMIEYALLFLLNYQAISNTTKINKKKVGLLAFLLTIVYAISDEIHQTYVPTREGRLRDVGFDTIGALIALFIIWRLLPKLPGKLIKLAKGWGVT